MLVFSTGLSARSVRFSQSNTSVWGLQWERAQETTQRARNQSARGCGGVWRWVRWGMETQRGWVSGGGGLEGHERVYRENHRSVYTEMGENSKGRENWRGKLHHSSWCLFICHIPGASQMLQTHLNTFKITYLYSAFENVKNTLDLCITLQKPCKKQVLTQYVLAWIFTHVKICKNSPPQRFWPLMRKSLL